MSNMVDDEVQFKRTYSDLSDDGLMRLSLEGGLTPAAQQALAAEMQRRSLNPADVKELNDWENEHARPAPMRRTILGYGWKFVGKKYLTAFDENEGIFVSTRFIVLMGMPMIPTGSYRADQRARKLPQIHNRVAWQLDQVWSGLWPTILLFVICAAFGVLSAYLTDKNGRSF